MSPVSLGVPSHALPQWRALRDAITTPTPCAGTDRDQWTGTATQQQRAAVACLDCPAMTACASYALAADEPSGTWGGRTAAERRQAAHTPSCAPLVA